MKKLEIELGQVRASILLCSLKMAIETLMFFYWKDPRFCHMFNMVRPKNSLSTLLQKKPDNDDIDYNPAVLIKRRRINLPMKAMCSNNLPENTDAQS